MPNLPAAKWCMFLATMTLIGATCSCTTSSIPQRIKKDANQLAEVGVDFDKYGTVTMSTPLLVRADGSGSPFAFDLGISPQQFYKDAKEEIQGKAGVAERTSLNVEAQARLSQDTTLSNAFGVASAERDRAVQLDIDRRAKEANAAEQERQDLLALATQESDAAKKVQAIKEANDRYYAKMAALYPAPGAIPTSQTVGAPADTAATTFSGKPSDRLGEFKDAFALANAVSSKSPTTSSRSAIIAAAGDTTIQGIFKVLGDPQKALTFEGRETLYGVTMISVTPGRHTRRKFAANVSATTRMALTEPMLSERFKMILDWAGKPKKPGDAPLPPAVVMRLLADSSEDSGAACQTFKEFMARVPADSDESNLNRNSLTASDCRAAVEDAKLLFELVPPYLRGQHHEYPTSSSTIASRPPGWKVRLSSDFSPTVAAVSPMTESQNMDLGSSSQSQLRIALALAASLSKAGDQRSASTFSEFARSLTAESISRSPQNLVTGYAVGNVVGYQVGPGFSALVDPGSKDPKSGEVLQRQSFPALMLFGVHPEIAAPKIHLVEEVLLAGSIVDGKSISKDQSKYKLLVLVPVLEMRQHWRWQPRRWMALAWRTLREDERLDWVIKVDNARKAAAYQPGAAGEFLYDRAELLGSMIGGTTVNLKIPFREKQDPAFTVASVKPEEWFLPIDASGAAQKTSGRFVVTGTGLNRALPMVTLKGAKDVTFNSLTPMPDGKSAIVDVTIGPKADGTLLFSFTENQTNNQALAGPISIKGQAAKPAAPMVRYREGNGSAITREIAVFGDAGSEKPKAVDALAVIKAEIEKAKPPSPAPSKPDPK